MTGSPLVLLQSSPRVAPGLLSGEAWAVLRGARVVHGYSDDPTVAALLESGVSVTCDLADTVDAAHLARALVADCVTGGLSGVTDADAASRADADAASRTDADAASVAAVGAVVWVGSGSGDALLHEAIATEVSRIEDAPQVEVLVGSWDVPGARLLDVVAVMDRLRSPGGCPWDAEQTHASLVPYLIEESHELAEAVALDDRDHLLEELGDVLLQVAFHARVAQDHQDAPFDIDDVAAGLVDKLVRRHPHVFADVSAPDAAAVEANWELIKAAEKSEREHPLDGVPTSLPALALADKYASRLGRAGLGERVLAAGRGDGVGERLLAAVLEAREGGIDAEQALRAVLARLRAEVAQA